MKTSQYLKSINKVDLTGAAIIFSIMAISGQPFLGFILALAISIEQIEGIKEKDRVSRYLIILACCVSAIVLREVIVNWSDVLIGFNGY